MTQNELTAWIRELIQENKLYQFYKSRQWLGTSAAGGSRSTQ